MKKNGFIATSILYSFFLIFITLFVALVMNYLHNQVLISKIDEEAWDFLNTIKSKKITDLKVGDYVQFRNNDAAISSTDATLLNEDSNWIVAYIEELPTGKNRIYFLSDLDAHQSSVFMKLSGDLITKYRPLTIDLYNIAKNNNGVNLYNSQLLINRDYSNRVQVGLATTSLLTLARNQKDAKGDPVDDNIINAIFNVGGDYVVYADQTANNYTLGNYYENRTYNFLLKGGQAPVTEKYCGSTFDGMSVKYNSNNSFGYTSIATTGTGNSRYVEFCSYASPTTYTHLQSEFVVSSNETKSDLITTTSSIIYTLRMMAVTELSPETPDIFVSGGKGLKTDPYIIADGVRRV